jgi:hypothetical protein
LTKSTGDCDPSGNNANIQILLHNILISTFQYCTNEDDLLAKMRPKTEALQKLTPNIRLAMANTLGLTPNLIELYSARGKVVVSGPLVKNDIKKSSNDNVNAIIHPPIKAGAMSGS